MIEVRCPYCDRKLAECDGIVVIKCSRCKRIIKVDTKKKEIKEYKSVKNTIV